VRETRRYLGLELSGAKNQKTCLATLEYYPKEKKIFLLDLYDKISPREDQSPDQALLELIEEVGSPMTRLGVNVPLQLPPCVTCTRKHCPLPSHCTVPTVKWMREFTKKMLRLHPERRKQWKEFTPYTQRPIELWLKYQVLPHLPMEGAFEVDESLGGTKAPLSARMSFLKRHLEEDALVEVWPKLAVMLLGLDLGLPKRHITHYRQMEEGGELREEILLKLAQKKGIFIYERDLRKLAQNLAAFDAFICAYIALLSDQNRCARKPTPPEFPAQAGWIEFPDPFE
jgi:hypothetical protein